MSNRGRKPNPTAQAVDPGVNESAVADASQAANALALNLRQIAANYGDGQDYDRARMVHEARMFMSSSAEAMLEAGKRLIVIRENEPHGEFLQIVEDQLKLNKRTAQLMMQAAVRFLSPAVQAKANSISLLGLGKTKLFELMAEPEQAILDLIDGGTVAGLKLDRINAMSTRELKAALLKSEDDRKKDAAAKDKVIASQAERNSQLEEKLARRQSASPTEREQAQLDDVREAAVAADLAMRRLIAVVGQVVASPATPATELFAVQAADYVCQVAAEAINEHGLNINFEEKVIPTWLKGAPAAPRG